MRELCRTRADYRALWDRQAAGLPETAPPPTFRQRLASFREARRRWKAAGKPTRSPETVKAIFEGQCRPCDRFLSTKDGQGQCGVCACHVGAKGTLLNKVAMGTEHCPLNKW